MSQNRNSVTVISHPLTDLTVRFRAGSDGAIVLVRIEFGRHARDGLGRFDIAERHAVRACGDKLRLLLDGAVHDLPDIAVDMDGLTPFRQAVLRACRRIPWGRTVSYAELAAMAGYPGAVRAAATVMRTNPFPLVVPCHRVVRSDGSLGGFMGAHTGHAVALKAALLRREGIDRW